MSTEKEKEEKDISKSKKPKNTETSKVDTKKPDTKKTKTKKATPKVKVEKKELSPVSRIKKLKKLINQPVKIYFGDKLIADEFTPKKIINNNKILINDQLYNLNVLTIKK